MKKYIKKVSLFLFVCFVILTAILLKYGGNIDHFYNKFTTPKAKSMILGDSRAMQGIQPEILNEAIKSSGKDYELPVYNYAFTIAQTPMGPPYRKSILRKLDKESKNGVYILSLTPWMFCSGDDYNDDLGEFREQDQPPHNMLYVDVNPNYEYILRNLNLFSFRHVFKTNYLLHKDGWMERKKLSKDEFSFNSRKKVQKDMIVDFLDYYKLSNVRKQSFYDLIKDLKEHGDVFFVRSPIDLDILEIENKFYPEFDNFIDSVAISNDIKYFNFTRHPKLKEFSNYDGHHIDKKGGELFTKALADSILSANQ